MEIFPVDVPTVIKSEYHLFPGKFSREWNLGTFPKRNSGSGQNCSSMTWSDLNAQPPRPPHALEMSQSELYGSDMLTVGFSRCWTIIGIIPLILWFLLSSLETATTFKILLRIKMLQKAAGLRLCLPFWKIKSYPKSSLSHKSNFFREERHPNFLEAQQAPATASICRKGDEKRAAIAKGMRAEATTVGGEMKEPTVVVGSAERMRPADTKRLTSLMISASSIIR